MSLDDVFIPKNTENIDGGMMFETFGWLDSHRGGLYVVVRCLKMPAPTTRRL